MPYLKEAAEMFMAAMRGERGRDSWPNFARYLRFTIRDHCGLEKASA